MIVFQHLGAILCSYSWTSWTYKVSNVGYWDSSWGLYNHKYKFSPNDNKQKLNLATATYNEFMDLANKINTTNCSETSTSTIIKQYQDK